MPQIFLFFYSELSHFNKKAPKFVRSLKFNSFEILDCLRKYNSFKWVYKIIIDD